MKQNKMKPWTYFICLLLLSAACTRDAAVAEEEAEPASIAASLPMYKLALSDLSAFSNPPTAWKLGGSAMAATEKTGDLQLTAGTGVLLGTANEISTEMQHGDLEMQLEFLLPKEGQARLLLQNKYGIHLQDTWQQEDKRSGMILGATAAENAVPAVNASRAPGLWQRLHFYFQAPRFDENGNKQSNAKMLYLKLNDYTLFTDQALAGPSEGLGGSAEVATGPFILKALSGAVAFRNIEYKAYTLDSLALKNIQFKLYKGNWDRLPQFDTVAVVESGEQSTLNVERESPSDKYGMTFSAQLEVPVTGDYLFETQIDDGGDLSIDGALVVHNDGEPGIGTERALVTLTAGTHAFDLSYYQDVWGKKLAIYYEGPSIRRQRLGLVEKTGPARTRKMLVINPKAGPELIRSFVHHKGVKRNFPISVGSPTGVHFTYDLEEGTLLQAWRGEFADVTDMWVGRGHGQVLVPGNASVEVSAGVPVAQLSGLTADWPADIPTSFLIEGYDIDAAGYPVFRYRADEVLFTDHILPTPDGNIERTVKIVEGAAKPNQYMRLAAGHIEALESGWYRIDGHYYIDAEGAEIGGPDKDQLLVPLTGKSSVQYTLIW